MTFRLSRYFFVPFDIRKGEGRKTLLMFFYFFFTVATLYILKPVRSSLFLEELGSGNLRYVYLGEGLLLLFVTWAYVFLAKRSPKKLFFAGNLLFFISNLLVFWWFFRHPFPYLSAVFYVWVACFSITAVTQFWTLANDLFDPLEAKRLFGLIISGGSAGGIIGGVLTNRAVRWVATEDLLLFCSFLLMICIFLISSLWKELPEGNRGMGPAQSSLGVSSAGKLFLNSSYLWMLAGIVLMAKVGSTIVDNQFNALVELHLIGKGARTAFFGAFSAWVNVVSLLMQLWATGLSLRFLGVGISLTLLPLGLGAASLATFIYPMLATGVFLKIFDGSMNYSIQQASKEVLYLPLPSGVRYRVKPVIDMLIYRASKSLGGLLIIAVAPLFAIPNDRIGILVLALVPFWLMLVWKMRSAYLRLLSDQLRKRKPADPPLRPRRAAEVLSFLYDEKSFKKLRTFLNQESTVARKMAATACLVYHRAGKDLQAARQMVSELIRLEALEGASERESNPESLKKEKAYLDELLLHEAEKEISISEGGKEEAAKNLQKTMKHIKSLLEDPKKEMSLKREAGRFLVHRADQAAVDLILEILPEGQDHSVRFLLIRALLRIRYRNSAVRLDRNLIKKEISREVELHLGIKKLHAYYLQSVREKREGFLEVALNAVAQESLERLFLCLSLLYPSEGIQIIYERIMEHPHSDPIRSHAVELLQNILGTEFSGLTHEIFEENPALEITEKEAIDILEGLWHSKDRWLSLAARFLAEELNLAEKHPRFHLAVPGGYDEVLNL